MSHFISCANAEVVAAIIRVLEETRTALRKPLASPSLRQRSRWKGQQHTDHKQSYPAHAAPSSRRGQAPERGLEVPEEPEMGDGKENFHENAFLLPPQGQVRI